LPEVISSDKGPITSPLYPQYYPTWQNCTWLVAAPQDNIVGYQFSDFDLGPGDSVELRDGKKNTATLLEFLTSDPRQSYWSTSNGPYLRVRFNSKELYTFKGFKLKIKFFKDPTGKAVMSSFSDIKE